MVNDAWLLNNVGRSRLSLHSYRDTMGPTLGEFHEDESGLD